MELYGPRGRALRKSFRSRAPKTGRNSAPATENFWEVLNGDSMVRSLNSEVWIQKNFWRRKPGASTMAPWHLVRAWTDILSDIWRPYIDSFEARDEIYNSRWVPASILWVKTLFIGKILMFYEFLWKIYFIFFDPGELRGYSGSTGSCSGVKNEWF